MLKEEFGNSSAAFLKVTVANAAAMRVYKGGDQMDDKEVYKSLFLSRLTDRACEHCLRGKPKARCKFSSGWLAQCDHCALNGRRCILMVREEGEVVWNKLGSVEVRDGEI